MFPTVRPFLARPVAVVIGLTLPLLAVSGCSEAQNTVSAVPSAGQPAAVATRGLDPAMMAEVRRRMGELAANSGERQTSA